LILFHSNAASFASENNLFRKEQLAGNYSSMDCETCDIVLDLGPTGQFKITRSEWDPAQNKHASSRSMVGEWRFGENNLKLLFPGGEIIYVPKMFDLKAGAKEAHIMGFEWVRSSTMTFVDRHSVLESSGSNKFLLDAADRN
jgi:hypothetical protein